MASIISKNIKELQCKLIEWFERNGRFFPWRESGLNQYQLIIAETLLQRTKAETVAKFYNKFIQDYPDWESLAKADINNIERYLKPIGLYRQRAVRLKNLAKEMVNRKNILPEKREELESIPFFGQYIANAVELMIFKKPSPLMDVNMARVLERYFKPRVMADIRYDPYLQGLAHKVIKNPKSIELNWAILDFAALICRARNPRCEICFLQDKCSYFKKLKKIEFTD